MSIPNISIPGRFRVKKLLESNAFDDAYIATNIFKEEDIWLLVRSFKSAKKEEKDTMISLQEHLLKNNMIFGEIESLDFLVQIIEILLPLFQKKYPIFITNISPQNTYINKKLEIKYLYLPVLPLQARGGHQILQAIAKEISSLGRLLYFLLTGAIYTSSSPPLSQARPDLFPQTYELFKRCDREQGHIFTSLKDLQTEIKELIEIINVMDNSNQLDLISCKDNQPKNCRPQDYRLKDYQSKDYRPKNCLLNDYQPLDPDIAIKWQKITAIVLLLIILGSFLIYIIFPPSNNFGMDSISLLRAKAGITSMIKSNHNYNTK